MEQLVEYSKELVDRFIKSMGYDPKHIDKDKRMAFTKTIRFQQFAQRMGEEVELPVRTESHMSQVHSDLGDLLDKHINKYKSVGGAENLAHHTDKASHKLAKIHGISPEHATKFVNDYVDDKLKESTNYRNLSKSATLIKSIYKENRLKEEIYDHEKDDKDGTTYGKKPKFSANKQEVDQQGQSDKKTQAAAVLSGGTTLTGQERDTVEIDPLLKKSKPGSPNGEVGNTKQ